MAEDRAAAPEMPVTERLSTDPDARWLKKGSRCFFGYKGFIRTDGDEYVERVLARPANEGEAPHFPALVAGCTARRVLADKGLASAANRAHLAAAGLKSGIMYRASRGHPLGGAPETVQPPGGPTALGRGAGLRHTQAPVPGSAVALPDLPQRGGGADVEGDGDEPAQGGQPDRPGRGVSAGVCLAPPEPGRQGRSSPKSATNPLRFASFRRISAAAAARWIAQRPDLSPHRLSQPSCLGRSLAHESSARYARAFADRGRALPSAWKQFRRSVAVSVSNDRAI